ncbi:MAG: hypothetical protein M3R55_07105 [Acidobacteriota bacterium]|nr:hypothetical protein [Acidobacteriota bacterium]
MRTIGLATCEAVPLLTPEDQRLAAALGARGIDARPVVWSTATAGDSHSLSAMIVRSCWDYHHLCDAFLAWADGTEASGTPVLNAPATLRRNAHKRYLLDLAARGIPVIATRLVEAGGTAVLRDIAADLHAQAVVIKPAVSASSFETHRLDAASAESEAIFRASATARDMLVQPFLPAIAEGELSLVFFDGVFSHAVIKRAADGDFRVQEEHGGHTMPCEPDAAVVAAAGRALRVLDADALYARIDGVVHGGGFLLTEAELIEPYLFLESSPGATDAFAAAIDRRLPR